LNLPVEQKLQSAKEVQSGQNNVSLLNGKFSLQKNLVFSIFYRQAFLLNFFNGRVERDILGQVHL
jgi:hypothetical protein